MLLRHLFENNVNAEKECGHSFVLKDDLGYVCRVCGVIRKSMDTMFDFQWGRVSKTMRTYMSEPQSTKEREECGAAPFPGVNSSHDLAKNLISDNPCGCIHAHAPGSGKTFMLISFIQSFLAKYPQRLDQSGCITERHFGYMEERVCNMANDYRRFEESGAVQENGHWICRFSHPMLKEISEGPFCWRQRAAELMTKLDKLLMKLDVRGGVKAKFFVNILGLCESSGEKLLVFCKYLLPMKFLERLVVRTKGWRVGKEIFMISSYVSQPK
ncbi:hypothetical protein IFM89_002305 [Coptis chinensis]|uniref:Uncharacterized protein n=1 Tax=Coptis chinensis TaxID=261450 RepID=A0A835M4A4_9MAGN|nr:hypothetical protein IFM89_002305 [Coptis chinensis]